MALAAGQSISAAPGLGASKSDVLPGAGSFAAWPAAPIAPALALGMPMPPVGSWLRADIAGNGGGDILVGGAGGDLQIGGAGRDLLVGGFAHRRPAAAAQEAQAARAVADYFQLGGNETAELPQDQSALAMLLQRARAGDAS
jgi:hypothetical protein